MTNYYSIPIVDGKPDIGQYDSFRIMHYFLKNDTEVMYGELNKGDVRNSWTKLTKEEFYENVPTIERSKLKKSQLDRIEEKLNQSYTEAKQEGADAITAELIERGLL